MPSKKKARSQARKAKKETQQAASSTDSDIAAPGDSSCDHIELPENRTLEDFKKAYGLFQYFRAKVEARTKGRADNEQIIDIYNQKFLLLDQANKDIFRQLLVSSGVQLILNGKNFIQCPDTIEATMAIYGPYIILLRAIDGCLSSIQLNHLIASPR
jgi:hypothetical protein